MPAGSGLQKDEDKRARPLWTSPICERYLREEVVGVVFFSASSSAFHSGGLTPSRWVAKKKSNRLWSP